MLGVEAVKNSDNKTFFAKILALFQGVEPCQISKNTAIAKSCDSVPHFTSIANFVSSYPDAIESVFKQVLLVCGQQGLLGKELFAIDGCKLPSNAAKAHSGTLDELAQKREKIRKKIRTCLKEHKKLDGRKPGERDRKQPLAKATDTLQKEFERIDQFLKTATPRMGQGNDQKK